MSDDTPISPISGKPFPKSQTYEGGCHCGKVSFSVRLSPPLDTGTVTICNCSICSINGYTMVYPLESQITWNSGFDELVPYTFGPARITHSFCPICGTSIGGKSNEQAFNKYRALNIRTLRGVDLDNLKIRKVDTRAAKVTDELSYDETKHPHNPYGPRII